MGFDACARASGAINRGARAPTHNAARLVCGMGFSIVYTLQHALAVNNHTIKSTRSHLIYYLRCDAGKKQRRAFVSADRLQREFVISNCFGPI